MRSRILPALLLAACAAQRPAPEPARLAYPVARVSDQVDEYHGRKVADPYRWLEDPDSEETRAWIEAQNRLARGYLDAIPERDAIRNRLTALWNYERFGIPTEEGGRYFYTRNDGLQNQSVLLTAESFSAQPRVLIDPNAWSREGTVALAGQYPSRDGKRFAYAVSTAGSDWKEIRVRDVATGKDLADRLSWVKFSGASWLPDGSGFFYARYPEAKEQLREVNRNHKVWFHRLGTTQEKDLLVYERPDQPDWGFDAEATEDGRYLILTVWKGSATKNALFYKELEGPGEVRELLPAFDAAWGFLGNEGPLFWFHTDLDAPRGRVVSIDTRTGERKEVIPQGADAMESVSLVGDRFVVRTLHDAASRVLLYRLDGTLEKELALPPFGSADGFRGRRSSKETFYTFSSFTQPPTIYRYDFRTGASSVFRTAGIAMDPDGFECRQFSAKSRDGTRVPIFVAHRKGLEPRGEAPALLYGYGGFGVNMTPYFHVGNLLWMEMGGVFAMPVLRGGGEYGEDWHQAGTKLRKQNVFDDFIAAAEWLIDNGYTSQRRLAIGGGSNGGLLVGACMTQRPELFGAALPDVGVMDMLRFHKFTIGWAWVGEYGSSEDPKEFEALLAYSPLHNLKPGRNYPATLVSTADHDDRVVPGHSFKFAAALQAAQAGPAPALIRIETKAGHGAGKPTAKRIDEATDTYAFLLKALDYRPPRSVRWMRQKAE